MLNVQKYLQNNTLENLENEFGIVITRYDDRVILNYNQIESPKFHPVCDECRGLILSYPDYDILCRPFDRFYNLNEGYSENNININDMAVLSKEDGSLINCYNDGNKWNTSSRKRAFAEGTTANGNTFHDVFISIIKEDVNSLMKDMNTNYTYIFEMCSPENRIVKRYNKPVVYLLGVRHNYTGEYISYKELENIKNSWSNSNILLPEKFTLNSLSEIKESIKNLERNQSLDEGFVCWNEETGFRIKVKSPYYVALHHLRNNGDLSPKNIAYLVFNNEQDEYLSVYPEDMEYFQPYVDAYDKLIQDINQTWNNNKDIDSQKEFALNVKDKPIGAVMFGLRKGLTLGEIFDNLTDKKKVELLEKYKEM